ncbi:MAG: Fur family transcriptional regulator [Eubacteriaceae bacterium]|jgi:Fur family ferric uptake transcriptional regulator
MTKQRRLILDIIEQSHEHLTAEEIYVLARQSCPRIAVGTVYRNLNVLTESGLIGKISMINQPDRYDRVSEKHHHLICSECGKIEDAPFTGIDEFLQAQTDQTITGYELNVFHVCEECRLKNKLAS